MRLQGMRRSRSIEGRVPMVTDGEAVIGGVGLPRRLAIGCETGKLGQGGSPSVNRP